MSRNQEQGRDSIQIAADGSALATEGRELKDGLWENGVYLGTDGFIYHVTASMEGNGVRGEVVSKRATGEYLRWVDGVFQPGEVPGEANAIHYRAARRLRELL